MPAYQSAYGQEIAKAAKAISERKAFSYNPEEDSLYRLYREQYTNLGSRAMRDTTGQAAALTGGYANTYAQQAGQQAYDSYLQKLNALLPELYDRAYSQYNDENENLLQQYKLLLDQENTAYGRYQDDYSNWLSRYKLALEDAENAYARESAAAEANTATAASTGTSGSKKTTAVTAADYTRAKSSATSALAKYKRA